MKGDALAYDAEGRMTQAAESAALGGGQATYFYDGDGRRVEKSLTGGTTVYVYDGFGQLAAEYNTAITPSAPCRTCYLSWDHLGSVRLVTDQNGTVVAWHDYLPFGEELPANTAGRNGQWGPSGDNVNQKFTGMERDQETGMDFFNARYYGAALGRFTSPDPGNGGADPMNPQSWNAYAYVGNNPLANVDPSGMDSISSLPYCGQDTDFIGAAGDAPVDVPGCGGYLTVSTPPTTVTDGFTPIDPVVGIILDDINSGSGGGSLFECWRP